MSRIDEIMTEHHRYKYAKRMQDEATREIDKAIDKAQKAGDGTKGALQAEKEYNRARKKADRADKIMKKIRQWAVKELGARLINENVKQGEPK